MIRVGSGTTACWHGTTDEDGLRCLSGEQAGDARALVVIDAEDRGQVERLFHLWLAQPTGDDDHTQLQAALREFADPQPIKPPEPMGLGAVVEDASGVTWVLAGDSHSHASQPLTDNWRQVTGGHVGNWQSWDRIDVATVLSEGIS